MATVIILSESFVVTKNLVKICTFNLHKIMFTTKFEDKVVDVNTLVRDFFKYISQSSSQCQILFSG